MADLLLVRHGETAWSAARRHTGRTDIPLTEHGRTQATALRAVLAEREATHGLPALVATSPLIRARETARLAGLDAANGRPRAIVDEDLVEWDYGAYEGLTADEISAILGRPWGIFEDGVPPGDTPGETLDQVAARADAVLRRVRPVLEDGGSVVLVAHGHLLRILAARWFGLDAAAGAGLLLGAGSLSTLGLEHGRPVLLGWNRQAVPDKS